MYTGNRTVMVMTKEWDVIAENDIPNAAKDGVTVETLKESLSWRGDGQFFCTNTSSAAGQYL
jgi:hypothetical protein